MASTSQNDNNRIVSVTARFSVPDTYLDKLLAPSKFMTRAIATEIIDTVAVEHAVSFRWQKLGLQLKDRYETEANFITKTEKAVVKRIILGGLGEELRIAYDSKVPRAIPGIPDTPEEAKARALKKEAQRRVSDAWNSVYKAAFPLDAALSGRKRGKEDQRECEGSGSTGFGSGGSGGPALKKATLSQHVEVAAAAGADDDVEMPDADGGDGFNHIFANNSQPNVSGSASSVRAVLRPTAGSTSSAGVSLAGSAVASSVGKNINEVLQQLNEQLQVIKGNRHDGPYSVDRSFLDLVERVLNHVLRGDGEEM